MINVSRQEVLNYIIRYKKQHDGNSPTIRQIRDDLDMSSTSVVSYVLDEIERMGKIKRNRNGDSRGIEVVGGRWSYGDYYSLPPHNL